MTATRPLRRIRPVRLVQLALVGAWLFAALALPAPTPEAPGLEMLASPHGEPLGLSNSKDGVAVLGASNMLPGSSTQGTVTLTNTGNVDSELELRKQNVSDSAGAGGGELSEVLDLRIENVTGAAPATIYDGPLATMPNVALGSFPKKQPGQTYRFTVTLPSGAGDAYQGSSTSVDYVWVQTKSNGNGPKGDSPPGHAQGKGPQK